jgi:hypothetical protein
LPASKNQHMTGHPRPVGYTRKIPQEEIVAELRR